MPLSSLQSDPNDVQPVLNLSVAGEFGTKNISEMSSNNLNDTFGEEEEMGSGEDSEYYYYEYYYDDDDQDYNETQDSMRDGSNQTWEETLPEAQPWISQSTKKGNNGRLLGAEVNFGSLGGKDVVWLSNLRSNISLGGSQFQTMAALGNAALVLGSALGVGLYPIAQRRSLDRATFRSTRRPPFPFYPPKMRKPLLPKVRARRPHGQLRRRRPAAGKKGRGRRKKGSRRKPGQRPKPRRIPTFSLSKPTPRPGPRPGPRLRPRPPKQSGKIKPEFTFRRQKPRTKRPRISAKPSIKNEQYAKKPTTNVAYTPKKSRPQPTHPFTKAHGYAPILPPGDVESNNYVAVVTTTTKKPRETQPTLFRENIPVRKYKGSRGNPGLDSPNDFLKDLDQPEFDGVRLKNPFRTDHGGSPFNLDPFRELKIIVNGDKETSSTQGQRKPKRRIAQSRAIKGDADQDQSLAQSQKHPTYVDPFQNAQAVHVIKKAEELNLFLAVKDVDLPRSKSKVATDPVLKELRSQLPLYPPTRILDEKRELGIASVKRGIRRKGQRDPETDKTTPRPIYLEDLYDYHDSEVDDSFKIELTERPVQTLPPSAKNTYEDDQKLVERELKSLRLRDFKRLNATMSPTTPKTRFKTSKLESSDQES
ncbi:hypothetical protein TCAL_11849 [Tigriopus californicus]|uniref:Uncharacterized protein n=2 Tax=Tigriopus californicus TaxID=6832 RepID=A0A553PU21_TIGCA|nr:hypothetical protein TCAL_11849 [Tigriopus californicus]